MSVQIIVGDCRKVLETLPSDSVDCIVTSPPYWGLRSYGTVAQVWGGDSGCEHEWGDVVPGSNRGGSGTPTGRNGRGENYGRALPKGSFCLRCGAWRGELGQEPTFSLWLQNITLIFRELRRVLKPTGTCWLNCGDAYASTPNGRSAAASKAAGDDRSFRDRPVSTVGEFAAKQRMMMPARLAIALQDDGWWIRDEIIWHKPNPMPSSIRDRTSPAHEMVYLLTKRARYYWDYVAVMEPCVVEDWDDGSRVSGGVNKHGANAKHGDRTTGRTAGSRRHSFARVTKNSAGEHGLTPQFRPDREDKDYAGPLRRRRSVWTIATQPMREAHFATFPEALVEPMILAGTSHRGCCRQCGKPWERVVDRHDRGWDGSVYGERAVAATGGVLSVGTAKSTLGSSNGKMVGEPVHLGWRPTCDCPRGRPCRPVVLDPFGGSGTVGLVADRHQRDAILIELNPEYAEIARQRIDAQRDTLFSAITVERRVPDADEPFEAAGRAGGDDPVAGGGDAAAADGL